MLSDPEAERTDGKKGTAWAYTFCIFCAFMAAFFFLINGLLVKTVPIFTLCTIQSLLGFLYMAIFISTTGADPDYSFTDDRDHGAFGFIHPSQAFNAFFIFGPVAAFWGNAGNVISLLFFSPVIVSACVLVEPFIGQMVAYWMKIDNMPGWATWVGTTLVFVGILGI